MIIAPLLALLALAGPAEPAQGADAKASAVVPSTDEGRRARIEEPKLDGPKKESWYGLYDGTHYGLQLDLGVPDVSGLSLVYRPYRFVRLEAGGNFNLLSGGLHGGVTVLPFHWGVVPTLHFEYGHLFEGDASSYAGSGTSEATKLALKQIGYDYADAQLGLEFGAQNRFVFFIRGGLFWLWTEAKNFQQAVNLSNSGATITANNPQIRVRGPSLNLGFLVYLF